MLTLESNSVALYTKNRNKEWSVMQFKYYKAAKKKQSYSWK